ncbi:MAG TPA: OsmC family protein [Lysobacter sp.]|jgi:putative redox protein|nr:OsmC family protein [Lysobacter sp.]
MPDNHDFPGLRAPLGEGEAFAHSDNRSFRTPLNVAGHPFVADEPVAVGGTDQGPSPYGLISAALASCTAMTLHSYAALKQLPVADIRVLVRHNKVHEVDSEHCEDDAAAKIDQLERTIWIDGDLPDGARERMMQIADRCPVHRTLHGTVRIVTRTG